MPVTGSILSEHSNHMNITGGRPNEALLWVFGLANFSYRPSDDGQVHNETLQFDIGPRLTGLYTAVPSVAITGVSFAPNMVNSVTIPRLRLEAAGSVHVFGDATNGVVNADGEVSVVGVTDETGLENLALNVRPIGWNLGAVSAALNGATHRAQLTIQLAAQGHVELTQVAYQVIMNIDTVSLTQPPPPVIPPMAGGYPRVGG